MRTSRSSILLIFACLSFLAGGVAWWLSPGSGESSYAKAILSKLQERISNTETVLTDIASPSNSPDTAFSRFRVSAKYPYFVFQAGKLVYWSSSVFVPNYATLQGNYNHKFYQTEVGSFVAVQRKFRAGNIPTDAFVLIPIYKKFRIENQNLHSGYVSEFFLENPEAITTTPASGFEAVRSLSGDFLFGVKPPQNINQKSLPVFTSIFFVGAWLFFSFWLVRKIRQRLAERRAELALFLLGLYLFGSHWIFRYFDLDTAIFGNYSVFTTKINGSYSLGDSILILIFWIILLAFSAWGYAKTNIYQTAISSSFPVKCLIALVCAIGGFLMLGCCMDYLGDFYADPSKDLRLIVSLDYSEHPHRWACLMIFVLLSILYFLTQHLLIGFFEQLMQKSLVVSAGCVLLAAGISYGFIWLLGWNVPIWIFLLSGVLFWLTYFTGITKFLYLFRHQTTVYFFLGAFWCAVWGATTIHHHEKIRELASKQLFGKEHLDDNDRLGEFRLSQLNKEISDDTLIHNSIQDSFLARERVQQRVKAYHLKNFFDSYDIEVAVYAPTGQPLDNLPNIPSFGAVEQKYRLTQNKTSYPNLFLVDDPTGKIPKRYTDFITVKKANEVLGYVVIGLTLREAIPQRVYSELLVDSQQKNLNDASDYSFAIFEGRRLVATNGAFNYRKNNLGNQLNSLFEVGKTIDEYDHVAIRGKEGKTSVVSSPTITWSGYFGTFSFLFLSLVIVVLFVLIGYVVRYYVDNQTVNLSTKIQLYLNLAFLLPLLLVVGITLSIIGTTLNDNQSQVFLSQLRNVGASLFSTIDGFSKTQVSRGILEADVQKSAQDAGHDLSFYDGKGLLTTASQPEIYEKGLLSKHLHPEAYFRIIEENERDILLEEQIGSLKFKTVYSGVKTAEGTFLGVLGMPFYDATPTYNRQIIRVLVSILNTFSGIFLGLLLLSYFAARTLTRPLRMIAQRLRNLDIQNTNEPISWRSDDEIGKLVGAYNQMLSKLDESKVALSQNEKQTAWREMAKQVAHEIKNPLTPMKLKLQQLQRTLSPDIASRKQIDRAFSSLIEQIDNISDIANSFSDFAKMPVPKSELYDLVPVVQKASGLYEEEQGVGLQLDIRLPAAYVYGDGGLMSRIVTNLIINAKQAIPSEKTARIYVRLYSEEEQVILEVQDNGTGIEENIRPKIFIPNFSTKIGGSGVGLAVAKRGVEHANGTIWFETEVGVGTTFYISFPIAGNFKRS